MCVCHLDLVCVLCVYLNSSQHHPRPTRDRHSLACLPAAHPQLASCSTRCRAGSHSRALALTPHAHHLSNASCVTGTTRGSLGCVCVCSGCIACVCVCGCALPCNTTRIGAQLEYPHCVARVTVARQSYSAMAALRASKHASQTLIGLSLRAS